MDGARSFSARSILVIAAALLGVALAGPALALRPADGAQVLVVFAPWVDAEEAAAQVWRADGYVLSQASWRIVARSDAPDFTARLRAAGAWLTLDADKLKALCGA